MCHLALYYLDNEKDGKICNSVADVTKCDKFMKWADAIKTSFSHMNWEIEKDETDDEEEND
jgi:hypothetical protein